MEAVGDGWQRYAFINRARGRPQTKVKMLGCVEGARVGFIGSFHIDKIVQADDNAMQVLSASLLVIGETAIGLAGPASICAVEGRAIPSEIGRHRIEAEAVIIGALISGEAFHLKDMSLPAIAHNQVVAKMDIRGRTQRARRPDESVVVDQYAGRIIQQFQRAGACVVV